MSALELALMERVLLRIRATSIAASRELGGLIARLALAREEIASF
jgi:hypothetical protein